MEVACGQSSHSASHLRITAACSVLHTWPARTRLRRSRCAATSETGESGEEKTDEKHSTGSGSGGGVAFDMIPGPSFDCLLWDEKLKV